jgi:hypothetical protein
VHTKPRGKHNSLAHLITLSLPIFTHFRYFCHASPFSLKQCGGTGGCSGATAELAFDYYAGTRGVYQEFQYGYGSYYGATLACEKKADAPVAALDGFIQLPANNYTALMNAIATVGPVGEFG